MFPTPVRADMDARLSDWQQLQRDGWDIFDHSTGGHLHEQTTAVNEYYRMAEIDYMKNHGFMTDFRALAPYGGTVDQDSLGNALQYYHLVRRTVTENYSPVPPVNSQFGYEGFIISGIGMEDSSKLNTYKRYVDRAKTNGKWLIFFGHRINSTEPCLSNNEFRELLDYIVSTNVPVVTIGDMMAMCEQGESLFKQNTVQDMFFDVRASDQDYIRSNEDISAAIPLEFTITNQPDVPRSLWIKFDSHNNVTAYTLEILGKDVRGMSINVTITESKGWDYNTSHAFSVINSIKMTSRTGSGVGDTIDIGISDKLGLSHIIFNTDDVLKIKKGNTNQDISKSKVDAVYNTYNMDVIGISDNDDFTIWYNYIDYLK
jgi:hypothetical protein